MVAGTLAAASDSCQETAKHVVWWPRVFYWEESFGTRRPSGRESECCRVREWLRVT